MIRLKYTYWQEEDIWIGYLDNYPDYLTQGESEEELQEMLADLYKDLNSGEIPHVRRSGELVIS
ncbi:MAG: type II toxin-antitoxin system HicB family antitoxin [Candidatus Kapaibacterium sp.]